jgi:putative ABC transport system substrate-binding protein
MTRRTIGLLVTLAFRLFVVALASDAQPPGRVHRIGYVSTGSPAADPLVAALRAGLRAHGYIEGQNLAIESRYTEGVPERLANLVTELVRLPVDIIVTPGTPATQAAQQATATLPIVTISGDPLRAGFVASLARPGGNITGLAILAGQGMGGKWLQLLKEAIPGLVRVNYLVNPTNAMSVALFNEMQHSAPALGVRIHAMEVRSLDDLGRLFAGLTREPADALFVDADPFFLPHRTRIVELAATSRLPALYQNRDYVEAGGLMSYGLSVPEIFRYAATYVDKILKGAKPADLPVEQPTTFKLVINLKTAQALGLTIPPILLFQADEIIR